MLFCVVDLVILMAKGGPEIFGGLKGGGGRDKKIHKISLHQAPLQVFVNGPLIRGCLIVNKT